MNRKVARKIGKKAVGHDLCSKVEWKKQAKKALRQQFRKETRECS